MNNIKKYNRISRLLHWIIMLMILSQYIYGLSLLFLNYPSLLRGIASLIESVGISIMPLLIFRFVWNIIHPKPNLPKTMSLFEIISARFCHYALYLLVMGAITTGALIHYQSDYFFIIPLPNLTLDPVNWHKVYIVHHYIIIVLGIFIIIHVLAAIKHKIVNNDGVWETMM